MRIGRLVVVFSFGIGMTFDAGATCYVNSKAIGLDDGSSWMNAYTNLQFALLHPAKCSEIWVAKGVYKPTVGTDPTLSFYIGPGMKIYGGFDGDETEREKREPYTNLTVLSGDIDNNDAHAADSQIDLTWEDVQGENSYNIVTIDGTTGTPIDNETVLDGVIITGGNGGDLFDSFGGGLLCKGNGRGSACSPTLSNLIFSGNQAREGGALFNDGSSSGASHPLIVDVLFTGNVAAFGGAVFNSGYAGSSNPLIVSSTFAANAAITGGAIQNDAREGESSPTVINATFVKNSANEGFGGAIVNDASAAHSSSNTTLLNVTFQGNTANDGGTIEDLGAAATALRNVILWDDTPLEIFHGKSSPVFFIDHSVIRNGCPMSATCSMVEASDPLLSGFGNYGGRTPTVLPGAKGSAVNNGSASGCPPTDQRGIARTDGQCDIGAVEWQPSDDRIFADSFDIH